MTDDPVLRAELLACLRLARDQLDCAADLSALLREAGCLAPGDTDPCAPWRLSPLQHLLADVIRAVERRERATKEG